VWLLLTEKLTLRASTKFLAWALREGCVTSVKNYFGSGGHAEACPYMKTIDTFGLICI
jgi:hypothetical protein